jgi:streptogramin lyase
LRRIAFLLLSLPVLSAAQQIAFMEYALPIAKIGPATITAGPDGAVWFTENEYIGRITTAGGIAEFPQTGGPWGITAGPDGALWFTLAAHASIGRMTTKGKLTAAYPVPNRGKPYGIATGSDGALWFTEYLSSKIGKMTNAGVGTEFPIAPTYRGPVGIAAGPDGALWFTEYNGSRIGRITTTGEITEYILHSANPAPYWITTGPDGALWFTEQFGNNIGRITTAGAIADFQVPTAGSQPFGIAPGPDGALWFTEYGANQIGRITTAGAVTEFPVPTAGSVPYQIALGPDGALWFTEAQGNKIGQIVFVTASLTVNPPSGSYGENLTFTGSGFAAGESVNVYASGVGSRVLASAAADSSGSFSVTARAPSSPYGPRNFLATGQTSGKLGAAGFSVTPRLILSPDSGSIGSSVAASGYGFAPLETVDLYWENPSISLGSITADVQGSFTGATVFTFTVPGRAATGVDAVAGSGTQSGAHGSEHFIVQ